MSFLFFKWMELTEGDLSQSLGFWNPRDEDYLIFDFAGII